MADQHLVYCNLPLCMVQHWSYVNELNECLMELVKFLDMQFRVAEQLLNPLVLQHQPNKNFIVEEYAKKQQEE